MSHYLDRFPEEWHKLVRAEFGSAYKLTPAKLSDFPFEEERLVVRAVGPREMKSRIISSLTDQIEFMSGYPGSDEKVTVMRQILDTLDESAEFMIEIKTYWDEYDAAFDAAHPRKPSAPAPPTAKQLNYLGKLGITVVPGSKAEASRLIDQALHG